MMKGYCLKKIIHLNLTYINHSVLKDIVDINESVFKLQYNIVRTLISFG